MLYAVCISAADVASGAVTCYKVNLNTFHLLTWSDVIQITAL